MAANIQHEKNTQVTSGFDKHLEEIMIACSDDDVKNMRNFIDANNIDVMNYTFQNSFRSLFLHMAAAYNNVSICEWLLNSMKVPVDIQDWHGCTPLYYARGIETTKLLISNNANVNIKDKLLKTALHTAVINDLDTEKIKILLLNGCDVNAQDQNSCTPLHTAVDAKNEEMVKVLLENGADKNIKNDDNETPLDMARKSNDISIIKLLDN